MRTRRQGVRCLSGASRRSTCPKHLMKRPIPMNLVIGSRLAPGQRNASHPLTPCPHLPALFSFPVPSPPKKAPQPPATEPLFLYFFISLFLFLHIHKLRIIRQPNQIHRPNRTIPLFRNNDLRNILILRVLIIIIISIDKHNNVGILLNSP